MYIQSTFIHLDKIGKHKENELWNNNILSWIDYQEDIERESLFFNDGDSKLYTSIEAYAQKDVSFFLKN